MKKSIAWLLVLVTVLSLLPFAAFAEGSAKETASVSEQAEAAPETEPPAESEEQEEIPEKSVEPEPEQPAELPQEEPTAPEEEPAEPAEKPEEEDLSDHAEEEAQPLYPWAELDDDGLIAYIRAAKNETYLCSLLNRKAGAEYAAFVARVEAIADRTAREEALSYLDGLIAQVPSEEYSEAPEEEEAQTEPEQPAEEQEVPQTAEPAEGEELPEGEEPEIDEGEELFEDGLGLALLGEGPEDGECGDSGSNVGWRFDPYSGTLTVSGTGAMADYENTSAPWYPYRDMIKTIRVEKGVTRIGNYAFYKLAAVREVTLPDTLTSIGECSFSFCGVMHVDLPDSLESIEIYAFGYSGLTEIVIPRKINCIERGAFWYCSELVSVTLPGSLTDINDQAFKCCGKLKNIVFPYALNHIGSSAFTGAALTSILIPEYVTSISGHAFSGCGSLEKVAFFGKITKIEDYAFEDCKKINKVHLPNMTEEEWAQVSIGRDNGWLMGVTPTFGPEIQGTCGKNVRWYYDVPSSLLVIEGTGSTYDYAVGSRDIPWYDYSKDVVNVEVKGVTGLGKGILSGLGGEEEEVSLKLPETLERIGESAFEGSRIKSVIIPDKVLSIAANAFSECKILESVTLPKNLEQIGRAAFYKCEALTSIELPDSLESIGDDAFGLTGLTSVTLPERIDSIGNFVFRYCDALETVEYKGTIRRIGQEAFSYCTALKNFVLPDTLISIGAAAFQYVVGLTSVTLPEKVAVIEWDTFLGCSGLKEVVFRGRIARIGLQAFSGCSGIKDVYCTDMTEQEWSLVPIAERNEPLTSATFHFKPYEGSFVTLEKKYLLLNADETAEPIGYAIVPSDSYVVYWFAADENMRIDPADPAKNAVISVDENGKITALGKGTAYVIASLTERPGDLSALCRVDVVKPEDPADPADGKVTGVTVRTNAVTTEVYKTDYTRIGLILELEQNKELTVADPGLLYPENIAPEAKAGGHSVTAAKFTNEALNELFALGIIDDRTLEIVPKDETIRRCLADDKSIKGLYKSTLKVTVKGAETPFETKPVTLTVKKTKPAFTAKQVRLNKVLLASVSGICEADILFLNAKNAGRITLEPNPAAAKPIPDGLELVEGRNAVRLTAGNLKNGDYKLNLLASSEGWAIKKQLTVCVTVTKAYPSVKFSKTKLTLNPNVAGDRVVTEMVVLSEVFMNPAEYPVTADSIRIFEGKTEIENGKIIRVEAPEGRPRYITVSNGSAGPEDRYAHTYTVKVSLAGREYPFTVKLLSKASAVKMTLKATGSINTRIPRSEAVISTAFKNLNKGVLPAFVSQIDKYVGSKLAEEDVKGVFNVTEDLGVFRVSLVKGMENIPEEGITYKLKITAILEENEIGTLSVRIPLKIAAKTPVPSVTLKVKGKIDVIRPGSVVTVKPVIKNYFGYVPQAYHIHILTFKGKQETDVTECFDIAPNTDDGSFTITARRGESLTVGQKYTVFFDPKISNGTSSSVMPGKSAVIKVVMGKAAFTASPNKIPLYTLDRHDKGVTVISPKDALLSEIKRIEFSGTRAKYLEAVSLGGNTYLIGYKDNVLPENTKTGTVSVRIWLEGNISDKPNVTLKITA